MKGPPLLEAIFTKAKNCIEWQQQIELGNRRYLSVRTPLPALRKSPTPSFEPVRSWAEAMARTIHLLRVAAHTPRCDYSAA
jgi:hypothetical protein